LKAAKAKITAGPASTTAASMVSWAITSQLMLPKKLKLICPPELTQECDNRTGNSRLDFTG
jgi:hypothetical protein